MQNGKKLPQSAIADRFTARTVGVYLGPLELMYHQKNHHRPDLVTILLSLAQVLLSRSLLLQLAGADITAANTPESPEPTGQDNTKLGDSDDFSVPGWLSVSVVVVSLLVVGS